MPPKLRKVVAHSWTSALVNDAHTMVCSQADMAFAPFMAAHPSITDMLPEALRLKVTATTNPHTLRIRVTTCPTGLQQWSEPRPAAFKGLDSWIGDALHC
jgi:hypothetical protein